MELNAAAPLTATPVDIFSMIPILGNNPAVSTGLSGSAAQNFSALLTELTGTDPNPVAVPSVPTAPIAPVAAPTASAAVQVAANVTPSLPAQPPIAPVDSAPAAPQIANTNIQPKAKDSQKPQESQKTAPADNPANTPVVVVPVPVSFVPFVAKSAAHLSTGTKDIKLDDAPPQNPQPVQVAAQQPNPELERAFADVKKFEYTVEPDTAAKPATTLQAKDVPAAAAAADPAKASVAVTTDPIVTVQQQQLPPRIIAIQKIMQEAKPSERSKASGSTAADPTAPTPTTQSSDLVRPVEQADQAAPANPIEIPNIPHLPVVRNVALEVGDPGSQVTIHIQERGGDLSMQLNTASDSLHQNLQSSVGALVQSLKQDRIQVSNVEVTRKSPIGKVRRMKEAH